MEMVKKIKEMYAGLMLTRAALDNKVADYCINMLRRQGTNSLSFAPIEVRGRYNHEWITISHICVDKQGTLLCGVVGNGENPTLSMIEDCGLMTLVDAVKGVSSYKTKTIVTFTKKSKGISYRYAVYCENKDVAKGIMTDLFKKNEAKREYYYVRQTTTGAPHKDAKVATADEYLEDGMQAFE